MKISAILALALALPSGVVGCAYRNPERNRRCRSRFGETGADEVIMGANLQECEILCNRASTNGNNGPCGGYEFRDHATNPDKRKCMLHYTNNSGSGSRSRSGDVRRGDRMDGVDCYIKENQMCQLRLSPEGDFDRNNDRRCNTDSTTRKRSFRGARRSQCQAMCYTRPNGYNTGEEICTAFEFAETSPPRCVLYYNGSPRRGDRRDDLRCYIQNNNTN